MLHFWADCCVQHVARPSGPRLIYRCSGCTKKMLINMFIMRQQKNSFSFFSSHSTIEIHNLIWTQSSSLSALLCVSFQRARGREREWGRQDCEARIVAVAFAFKRGPLRIFPWNFDEIYMRTCSKLSKRSILLGAPPFPPSNPPFYLPLPLVVALPRALLTCVTNALLKLDFKLAKNAA